MFKHVNDNIAGDRRVEWQADRRVPDSTEGIRDNIHNDCRVSLIQFQDQLCTISLELKWWGHIWLGPIATSIDCEFPS